MTPTQEQLKEIEREAGEKWESANRFYSYSGGVNPTPFKIGYKSGYLSCLEKYPAEIKSLQEGVSRLKKELDRVKSERNEFRKSLPDGDL